MTSRIVFLISLAAVMTVQTATAVEPPPVPSCELTPEVCLQSLNELSTGELRKRNYASKLTIKQKIKRDHGQLTYMLGYQSGSLALFSRLDLPSSEPPAEGYPLLILAPGWISRKQALDWDFGLSGHSTTSSVIQNFRDRGFAVVTAGYRGRGRVKGVRAQGIEFRDAWGNGSYVSPIFYAIDVLNLIAGIKSLDQIRWKQWLPATSNKPTFNYDKISLWGHSQGGDVGITVLAVAGRNPDYPQPLFAASLWSGNIPDRFTQANTFGAMASTTQAFLSGDGTWTGSAVGKNGELNPDFVFPWPSDWIGTVDTTSTQWTWQAQQWSTATVAEARQAKYREMYDALNRHVKDMTDLDFEVVPGESGQGQIRHASAVAAIMPTLGGYNYAQYIDIPLALHVSDRDYYSFPTWNHDLVSRITEHGGKARVYIYPGNTHSLKVSEHTWFSPLGSIIGAPIAMDRDAHLFRERGLAD
ncbi:MAG: hypothetical protein ABJN62_11195 [Halioglobus sp.]